MNDVMKKRVVGAIVLVIIGILLPLLLARCLHGDGGGQDSAMRVYEVAPDGQARPAGASDAQVAEQRSGDADSASERSDIDGSSGVPAREDTPAKPQAVSPSATSAQADDSADEEQSFETPPVQGNNTGSESTTTSSASSNTTTSSASSSGQSLRKNGSEGSGWVIQVASFGDEDNAQRLATQLNADYRAFYRAGQVSGKTWYRVRIGPFDSESQARTVAARLRQQGRATLVQRAE